MTHASIDPSQFDPPIPADVAGVTRVRRLTGAPDGGFVHLGNRRRIRLIRRRARLGDLAYARQLDAEQSGARAFLLSLSAVSSCAKDSPEFCDNRHTLLVGLCRAQA